MNKKLITTVAVCGLIAGVSMADTFRSMGNMNWADSQWQNQTQGSNNVAPPGLADVARMNWGEATCTLSTTESVGQVQMGVDEGGTLQITGTGSLTTTSWTGVGVTGTEAGVLNIAAGGVLNSGSHLWCGAGAGTTGILSISGTLNVGGNIGLGTINAATASGGAATLTVNDGGLLNLHHWSATTSIFAGSVLNINEGGTVIVGGNRGAQADAYFALGLIASDQGGIQSSYDGDLDQTTITPIPEPATLGLFGAFGAAILFIRRRFVR